MDVRTAIIVHFLNGDVQEHSDIMVQGVAKLLPGTGHAKGKEPILISRPQVGDKLYYNEGLFMQYAAGNIDFEELHNMTLCDGLYRNRTELHERGDRVEEGCLWMLLNDELTLIDDNRFAVAGAATIPKLFDKVI